MSNFLFTSESVTEGHPDKVCDQISDAILDAILQNDSEGRVACETLTTTNLVVISGEITTKNHPDYDRIVRDTIRNIGYTDNSSGFSADNVEVKLCIDEQSPEIAQGVNELENRKHKVFSIDLLNNNKDNYFRCDVSNIRQLEHVFGKYA